VVDAVYHTGGRMVLQLWRTGAARYINDREPVVPVESPSGLMHPQHHVML